MNLLRRVVSFIVLVAAVVTLIGVCMSSSMNIVWDSFKSAFSPFSFTALADAMALFLSFVGMPIILIMLGFLGLTMPRGRR